MKLKSKVIFKAILLCSILLVPCVSSAQERKIQNRPFLDDRVWHYGFLVGLHAQDLKIENNGLPYITENGGLEYWYADVPEYIPGFSVGILGELKVTDWLALRMVPTMHFGDRKLVFIERGSNARVEQYLKSTLLSVPFDLKISPLRFNNYRPYVVTGLAYDVNLTLSKGGEFLLKRGDTMFEIGFGFDLYYQYFKLIPELKFCFGLDDVHERTRKDLKDLSMLKYSNAVDRAISRMITFSLYFE